MILGGRESSRAGLVRFWVLGFGLWDGAGREGESPLEPGLVGFWVLGREGESPREPELVRFWVLVLGFGKGGRESSRAGFTVTFASKRRKGKVPESRQATR